MEGCSFDRWAIALAAHRSRRRLLGGVAAGLLGALGLGRIASAAPRVEVCHRTGRSSYQRITIPRPALEPHLAHGDVLYHDCCNDADCQPVVNGSHSCVAGACQVICDDGAVACEPGGAICYFGEPGQCEVAGKICCGPGQYKVQVCSPGCPSDPAHLFCCTSPIDCIGDPGGPPLSSPDGVGESICITPIS